jgi:hypothetical protein
MGWAASASTSSGRAEHRAQPGLCWLENGSTRAAGRTRPAPIPAIGPGHDRIGQRSIDSAAGHGMG